jgi:hypothetical protein
MSPHPLGSLRHLLHSRADKARERQPQFAVSDVILAMMIIVAVLVLLVEGASYLVSAMQIEIPRSAHHSPSWIRARSPRTR